MTELLQKNADQNLTNCAAKNFNGIDLIKFICAFLVCIIHVDPLPQTLFPAAANINFILQQGLCRIAVPFFFMASGFFLFKEMGPGAVNREKIRTYCFKLLRLLGIWTVLLRTGDMGHLWYLGATVVAVTVLGALLRRGMKYSHLFVLASGLYLIGLLDDSYYGLIYPLEKISVLAYGIKAYHFLFWSTRNGLFMGFIFVLIGAFLANHTVQINIKTSVCCFVISTLLMLAEVLVLKHLSFQKDYNMTVFLLPTSFFFFNIAANMNLKDSKIYKRLRVLGVMLFFLHQLIDLYIGLFLEAVVMFMGMDLAVFRLPLVLVISLAIGLIVEHISKHEKFQWLRWLYC